MFFFIPFQTVLAINISALYLSDCKREVGIILDIDHDNLQLLSLKGDVMTIPKYEVIYVSNYTLDTVPINNVSAKNSMLFKIKTFHKNEIVDLLTGWPVDYTEDNISFLTLEGKESVIGRDNIWTIEIIENPEVFQFQEKVQYQYNFIHPYPFSHCPVEIEGNISSQLKPRKVYPQQLLNEQVVIKKEFDRLLAGKEQIYKYHREQQFYPVPHVYKNKTTLGYWFSMGSRYGSSKYRDNNLSPILANEFSSGPFGYQHLFLTGSAPMLYGIHEEPQTQIYYRFKADYFHMAFMLDPSLFLIGSKYFWEKDSISKNDDRMNSDFSFELGFDYGHITVQLFADAINFGARYDNLDYADNSSSLRWSLSFHNHLFKVEAQVEHPAASDINIYRLNGELYFIENVKVAYSLIYRMLEIDYDGYLSEWGEDDQDSYPFYYKSKSLTNAFYLHYVFNYKFNLGAFASLEYHSSKFGNGVKDSNFYPKGGLFVSLNF